MNTARTIALALTALVAAACASSSGADEAPQGTPADVEVLDSAFVRFEGKRIALEWFLLEMRERVRAADGDVAQLPLVRVTVAPDAPGVDGRWIAALRNELYKAGVRNMSLEAS